MKINDVLNEDLDYSNTDLTDEQMRSIIDSQYFKINIVPHVDKNKDIEDIKSDLFHRFLYHGSYDMIDYDIREITDREKPRDTPKYLHTIANFEAKQELGINIRNKMFVTNDLATSGTFGRPHVVIPSDDYTLYTSTYVHDFTFDIANKVAGIKNPLTDEFIKLLQKKVNNQVSTLSEYISKLRENYLSKFEVEAYLMRIHKNMYDKLMFARDKEPENDPYDILNYKTFNSIKDVVDEVFENLFRIYDKIDDELQTAIMNNIGSITEEVISVFNQALKNYYKPLVNKYIDSIYSTKELTEDMMKTAGKEIILDASNVIIFGEDKIEYILYYYVNNY